ncbi:hypothetical protein GOODEAATRI_005348 [Goodea atripinnis]|uniref:Cohesin loading complex subunit SCC4 homolog n=1 Tax=Goodea atripinnis TaxID=208336 RepID=A0ABV0PL52_9TELE
MFGPTWQPAALVVALKNLLSGKMASNVEAPERWYLALLGFAEHFRTSSPPKIRLCVHCLQAVFQFKPPQRIEARTHLQLGSVLYHHTKNSELARSHLEKAQLHTLEKDLVSACDLLGVGAEYARVVGSEYTSPILSTFQVILLEHIIMCRLVTGHKATALQEVRCFYSSGRPFGLYLNTFHHTKKVMLKIEVQ